jgi:hypothetical protein
MDIPWEKAQGPCPNGEVLAIGSQDKFLVGFLQEEAQG